MVHCLTHKSHFQVCFGIHQLNFKYPKVDADRQKFDDIVNSFITYINHKNEYPHRIAKIEDISNN